MPVCAATEKASQKWDVYVTDFFLVISTTAFKTSSRRAQMDFDFVNM